MSSSDWDDFERVKSKVPERKIVVSSERHSPDSGCTWGQADEGQTAPGEPEPDETSNSKFITLYELYLNDKKSLVQQTTNYEIYSKDPKKELQQWLENEGHEFEPSVEQIASGQFVCTIDLPVQDQDFVLTSETHTKRKSAIEEVCLDACRLLDDCQLLFTNQSTSVIQEDEFAKKRRIAEANREDDIVFDKTSESKRFRSSNSNASSNQINTYDSLMAKWNMLSMNILQSKAQLVKIDLSLTNRKNPSKATQSEEAKNDTDDDDEVDPLDEFMSNLNTKTKLSMDDKIEKSRLRAQISTYERQQAEVARLLELVKPSLDANRLGQVASKQ